MPSHSGHQGCEAASGTNKRARSSAAKSAGSMRVLPAGRAERKARAPAPASENSVARVAGLAASKRASQAAVLRRRESSRCLASKQVSKVRAGLLGSCWLKAVRAAVISEDVVTTATKPAQACMPDPSEAR